MFDYMYMYSSGEVVLSKFVRKISTKYKIVQNYQQCPFWSGYFHLEDYDLYYNKEVWSFINYQVQYHFHQSM